MGYVYKLEATFDKHIPAAMTRAMETPESDKALQLCVERKLWTHTDSVRRLASAVGMSMNQVRTNMAMGKTPINRRIAAAYIVALQEELAASDSPAAMRDS